MKKPLRIGLAKHGKKRLKKKGIITEYLPWMLIALAVLAILMITIFVLKGKGISLIDKIKDLLRFR